MKRRIVLHGLMAGALLSGTGPLFARNLNSTPPQTEGPFYPDRLPLDQDNDLVAVAGRGSPANGEVTDLTGRILDLNGRPLGGVEIEIWQVDHHGIYLHSGDRREGRDVNFQGFGRFETGRAGEFRFRTIKPVPYPGRTPHIHVKLKKGGRELLTTQLYVRDHPLNARDGLLRSIRDSAQRESVLVPFVPAGGFEARCDIVLGVTPPA
jgi:protocatechuate 3,4-dioxygenase beta subunit